MTVLGVSNDGLTEIEESVRAVLPQAELLSFSDPLKAVQYSTKNSPDIALVESEMQPADGHSVAKLFKRRHPDLFIIMLSNDEKKNDVLGNPADVFVKKPITPEKLYDCLQNRTL